jgi:NADPH2:quinone reductase
MRSLQLSSLDGPDALRVAEVPAPAPGDGVLIEVHAAGVTFPDLLLTQGTYHVRPELPFAPGVEVAGVVRFAPAGSGLAEGDRVAAYTPWGGWAELINVPAHQVVPLPDAVDFVDGVALMVNYQTAYFALASRGGLRAGETVLVHGAAGGVGSAAIQVGLALGARVLAVARGPEKMAVARASGAEEVLDAAGEWAAEARAHTDGRGVDVVVDPVGGDRLDESLKLIAPAGRLLIVGFAEGRIPQIPANRLLLKNIAAVGVGLGPFVAHAPGILRSIAAELAALLPSGHLCPVIGATYPLEAGACALRELAARRAVGKSVLLVR